MAKYDPNALKTRLAPLQPLALVALTAACAERANPVYENYWVGDHLREVREAIDVAWTLCAGTAPDPIRLKKLVSFVRDHVEFLNEEGITILASSAAVSLRVLECMIAKEDQKLSARRAVGSALYVAQLAAKFSKTMDEETATEEEVTWHNRAIDLVDKGVGPWDAEVFRRLGDDDPPKWWRAYEAGSQHI
jgi:hypothetical protein